MGIKERREKEKEQLKELILKEATKMFLDEGFDKISMRKIADRIDYSVGTLYLYFKNKNELFYEVQAVAFGHFLNYMRPLLDIIDPVERLMRIGETYIFFALNNKEYYDLMFMMKAPMEHVEESEGWKRGQRSFEILVQTVEDLKQAGYFDGKDSKTIAMAFWSSVHGLVSLHLTNRLEKMSQVIGEPEDLIKKTKALIMAQMLK